MKITEKRWGRSVGVIAVATAVAGIVSWAAGQGGASVYGVPVTLVVFGVVFAMQWTAFVPSFLAQTEHFFDAVGSATFVAAVWLAVWLGDGWEARSLILAGLVTVWTLRLGLFLFRRVRASGKDGRFDEIVPDGPRFLSTWTLQGLWVSLTAAAALAAITSVSSAPLGALDIAGLSVWVLGFSIEVVADRQKRSFKRAHPGKFVNVGLWAWSRHPNYFGEIVLWVGVALVAASALSGWQWVTLISPAFVALLLMKVSGIPLLEARAEARWGDDLAYRRYRELTPMLIPLPPALQASRPTSVTAEEP